MNPKYFIKRSLMVFTLAAATAVAHAQESPKEEDFFRIARISSPEGNVLEVGGLTMLPNGNLGVATRRGDVFIIENPTSGRPYFRKFASGLHEVLGLAYKDGSLYCAQRGELTKLTDTNKDGKADLFETVYQWPLSGHYHEYSFGPKIAPDGSFFVSGNVAFGDEEWYRGESRVPWRGWIMKITPDGQMQPWATGVRSPCGLGIVDDELFYADNQGDWIGSGGIVHVKKGSFMGHPAGLRWASASNSPVTLTEAQFRANVDERRLKDANGRAIKPDNVQNEKVVTLTEMKRLFPMLQTPAVWLPHGIYGISNSEILRIPDATFGPFAGQLLIGDQGQSKIMRVFMEKVGGEYQGAAFDFRSGFQSGVLRMAWAPDGSLMVGETNRGWGSAGEAAQGLQRLVWNGKLPFEMRAIRAMPDGFEIEFTKPVSKASAEDIASYNVESFLYKYHPAYGSPTVNTKSCAVKGVKVSDDGMKARIIVDGLRPSYIHHIRLDGVQSAEGSYSLVHPMAYYTLNQIPEGAKLTGAGISTKNSAKSTKQAPAKTPAKGTPQKTTTAPQGTPDDPANRGKATASKTTGAKTTGAKTTAAPTYAEIKPLLAKNTCLACHNPDKRQVGPAYKDVAKRKYSIDKIVQLIYNPKPENWPDYATPMPPMPQVPKEEARKIAQWINSLK